MRARKGSERVFLSLLCLHSRVRVSGIGERAACPRWFDAVFWFILDQVPSAHVEHASWLLGTHLGVRREYDARLLGTKLCVCPPSVRATRLFSPDLCGLQAVRNALHLWLQYNDHRTSVGPAAALAHPAGQRCLALNLVSGPFFPS
eukprot:373163-Rhodomonas_salina.1